MERLTKRSYDTTKENFVCCTHFHSPECFIVEGNCSAGCKWEEAAWSRLADYEDTRLTPGEVRSLWGEWNAMMRVLNSIGSYDRLRELAEADKNGRVMIAPCKVGDTAYWVHNRTVTVCRVYRIQMNRKGTFICLKSNKSHGAFRADVCLGKTIFFNSEEAEKAIGEKKNVDEIT